MEKDSNLNIYDLKTFESILEAIQEEIEDSESDDDEYERVYLRETSKSVNYKETAWFSLLQDKNLENPNSKISRLFQLRFRIPYLLFKHYLVKRCNELNIFDSERECPTRCPIEIKIMACLRLLGRGLTYDDINEMSKIPNSTIPQFLHTFCENMATRMYEPVIEHPAQANFQSRIDHYAAIGLPGAMGSLDCTRIRWGRCPKKLRNWERKSTCCSLSCDLRPQQTSYLCIQTWLSWWHE